MCRQNILYGSCVIAFGLGVLIGTWLESGLICHLIGFGLVVLGLGVLRKH